MSRLAVVSKQPFYFVFSRLIAPSFLLIVYCCGFNYRQLHSCVCDAVGLVLIRDDDGDRKQLEGVGF